MTSPKDPTDALSALASEACDIWQAHLTQCLQDPSAKDELLRLMEPSRQLFADWAKMVQTNGHASTFTGGFPSAAASSGSDPSPSDVPPRPAPSQPSSDDGSLRLAQLAYRVAELEKRVAHLEPDTERAPSKTSRRARPRSA